MDLTSELADSYQGEEALMSGAMLQEKYKMETANRGGQFSRSNSGNGSSSSSSSTLGRNASGKGIFGRVASLVTRGGGGKTSKAATLSPEEILAAERQERINLRMINLGQQNSYLQQCTITLSRALEVCLY